MSPQPLRGKRMSDIPISKTWNIKARHLVAPIAAFTMASLLFVYTRSSINAAKRNAKRHREADGGQISWYNESQRRHGSLGRPGEQETLRQLVTGAEDKTRQVVTKGKSMSGGNELLKAKKVGSKDDGR